MKTRSFLTVIASFAFSLFTLVGCGVDDLETSVIVHDDHETRPAPPSDSGLTIVTADLSAAGPSADGTAIGRWSITSDANSQNDVSVSALSFTVQASGTDISRPRITVDGDGTLEVTDRTSVACSEGSCTVTVSLKHPLTISRGETVTVALRVIARTSGVPARTVTLPRPDGFVWREGQSDANPLRDGTDSGFTFQVQPQVSDF